MNINHSVFSLLYRVMQFERIRKSMLQFLETLKLSQMCHWTLGDEVVEEEQQVLEVKKEEEIVEEIVEEVKETVVETVVEIVEQEQEQEIVVEQAEKVQILEEIQEVEWEVVREPNHWVNFMSRVESKADTCWCQSLQPNYFKQEKQNKKQCELRMKQQNRQKVRKKAAIFKLHSYISSWGKG